MILKTSLVLGLVILVSMVAPVHAAFIPDWYTKGYVEAAAKLPMSAPMNANYTQGYKNAIEDNFGIPVKIPSKNLNDFYDGISDGVANTDKWMNLQKPDPYVSSCPLGHSSKEWCAGFNFGDAWEGDARDGM